MINNQYILELTLRMSQAFILEKVKLSLFSVQRIYVALEIWHHRILSFISQYFVDGNLKSYM